MTYSSVVAVNVTRSINERPTVREAAERWWSPAGRATASEMLEQAEIVVAVRANVIVGVFATQSVTQNAGDFTYTWELTDVPALRGLVGHRIPKSGPYWVPGDGAAWKVFKDDEFEKMVEAAKKDVFTLGSHTIHLLPDGSLEIGLAPGFELHVTSLGALPSSRERIAAVVHRLSESSACATYTAVAQMLGMTSAQAVARSVTTNSKITAEQGARVLPFAYADAAGTWTVPAAEPGWETQDSDERGRAQILIDLELGQPTQDGAAIVPGGTVITDGAALRRYLNV